MGYRNYNKESSYSRSYDNKKSRGVKEIQCIKVTCLSNKVNDGWGSTKSRKDNKSSW